MSKQENGKGTRPTPAAVGNPPSSTSPVPSVMAAPAVAPSPRERPASPGAAADTIAAAEALWLRHMAIVESTDDAIVAFDLSGRITDWNPAAESLFGYTPAEAIGAPAELLVSPHGDVATTEGARGTFDRALAGEIIRQETRRIAKGGIPIDVSVTATQLREPTGRVIGVSKIFRDIRQRKATEEALRASKEELQSFLDAAAIGLVRLDRDLRYVSVNRTYALMLGRSAGDIVGRHIAEVLSAQALQRIAPSLQQALAGERTEFEVELPLGDSGSRWLHVIYTPERGGDGQVTGLVGSITDISVLKRTEADLRAAHDTFRHLVANSPFGIYAVDADFRIVYVGQGASKVFKTVQPVVGRDLDEVLHVLWPEPFAGEAVGQFRRTLETGTAYHSPITVERRKDVGQTEAYDWKIERLTLPDGRLGVVCHFYDLSERQRYEERIRLLMLEVNHRSKNLMTIAQAIARQTAASSPSDFVTRFSQRLRALAVNQDLLVENAWRGVSIQALVEAQLAHFADLVGTRILIGGPPLALNAASAQAIGLALHELAANAVKYGSLSKPTGRVEISWTVEDGDFTIAWLESGGPHPRPATATKGFGTTVITSLVETSVGGKVALGYEARGFSWRLRVPAAKIADEHSTEDAGPPGRA